MIIPIERYDEKCKNLIIKRMSQKLQKIEKNKKFNINDFMKKNDIQNYIFEYLMYGKRKKGIIVGFIDFKNNITVGYSLCEKRDIFSLEKAFEIAVSRGNVNAIKSSKIENKEPYIHISEIEKIINNIPLSVYPKIVSFMERCKRYFKESPFNEVLRHISLKEYSS